MSSSSAAAIPTNGTADDAIRLADFSYDLRLESIAKYPAFPRGSSKLLRVDADGNVSFYDNFTDSFGQFAAGAHIVFNESKVVNGRLNVRSGDNEEAIEMMILDMGDTTGTEIDCIGVDLKVMLRRVDVPVGTKFVTSKGMGTFEVVHVDGLWEEDEHSNGNGTECTVRCIAHDESIKTVGDMLDAVGMVPIPPYLDREAEESDAALKKLRLQMDFIDKELTVSSKGEDEVQATVVVSVSWRRLDAALCRLLWLCGGFVHGAHWVPVASHLHRRLKRREAAAAHAKAQRKSAGKYEELARLLGTGRSARSVEQRVKGRS